MTYSYSLFIRRSAPVVASALGAVGAATIADRNTPHCQNGQDWSKRVTVGNQGGIFSFLNASRTLCDSGVPMDSLNESDATVNSSLTTTPTSSSSWRNKLPHPLNTRTWLGHETITTKSKDDGEEHVTEVFLLGTHHYSNASVKATTLLLESVQPDVVLVELCPERVSVFTAHRTPPRVPIFLSTLMHVWTNGVTSFGQGLCWALAGSLYSRLSKEYGGEFRAAYDYVVTQPKETRPTLLLADRPSSVTDARLKWLESKNNDDATASAVESEVTSWTLDSLYGNESPVPITQEDQAKTQAYDQLYRAWEEQASFQDFLVEGVIENDELAITLLPPVATQVGNSRERVSVQERDVYMVCKLVQACRVTKPKRIVAIVGANHLRGMTHLLCMGIIENGAAEPEEIVAELLTTEKYSRDNARIQELSRQLGYIELWD